MIRCLWLVFIISVVASYPAQAKIIDVLVNKREMIDASVPTGGFGPYERLEGVITFSFDPENPQNAAIEDLSLAPRNAYGQVEARANFVVLQPADVDKRRGVAWLEVSNRGSMASLRYFQNGGREENIYGDGLFFRQGLSLIWVGWQYDVPKGGGRLWFRPPPARNEDGSPLQGLVRSDWVVDEITDRLSLGHRTLPTVYRAVEPDSNRHRLTRRPYRNAQREEIDRSAWRFSTDGRAIEGQFEAGYIYELVYLSEHPRVVGLGLAAIRDMASFVKYDAGSPFPAQKVIGFGVSQTGRFLRHFLYQGFNVDEAGRLAFDGMFIHTAGAGRGSFNHRFAQPSRDAHAYSAFFYPTDVFPFSSHALPDQAGDVELGLLDRLDDAAIPKIVTTNTGYEYWGRAAALVHSDWRNGDDVSLHPNERLYHIAGGQHYVGGMPESLSEGTDSNPLNFFPILRALSLRLVNWVDKGIEPPASQYPTRSSKTLVAPDQVNYPEWVNQARPIPEPHSAYWSDFSNQPPEVLGEMHPLVPQVDEYGNEMGGIRLPQLNVPVVSFIPWSKRLGMANPDALRDFEGHIVPIPGDLVAVDKARFMAQSREFAEQLIEDGLLMREDIPVILSQQSELWDLTQ